MDKQDKRVIVTGASRGIGRSVVRQLAEQGCHVAALARNQQQLKSLRKELHGVKGQVRDVVCDMSQPEEIAGSVDGVEKVFGGVDVLVNNAGAFLEAEVTGIELRDWEYLLSVNLTGVFLACKAVLPGMKTQQAGRVINVSSVAGLQGYYGQAAYCASKHGVQGFTRALAIESKPYHVHVHAVCPGGVDTGFIEGTYLAERLADQTMLSPEDVARTVTFLVNQPDNVDVPEVVMRRFHVE